MSEPVIVTITVGTILQGDGVSHLAEVLQHKQADEYTDIILCHAPLSFDPYVVWTYNHDMGKCYRGEYFDNYNDAMTFYTLREF